MAALVEEDLAAAVEGLEDLVAVEAASLVVLAGHPPAPASRPHLCPRTPSPITPPRVKSEVRLSMSAT